jgi:hypothetical protein
MLQAAMISRKSCGGSPCIVQDAAEGGAAKATFRPGDQHLRGIS